jgi:hypothetical protein
VGGGFLSCPVRPDLLWRAAAGEEQVAALPALIERAPPGQVLWAGPTSGSRSARRLQELFSQAHIEPVPAEAGLFSALFSRLLGRWCGAALRTAWEGWTELSTDGEQWVEVERK